MKRDTVLVALAALTAASLACSVDLGVPRLETGPTETVTLSEPLPDDVEVVEMTLNMAAGELDLAGGAEGVLEGEIRYNVVDWAPTLVNEGNRVTLDQGEGDTNIGLPTSGSQIINEWALKLGDIPYELTLNAGAYEGSLDLTGVPLRRLEVHDGASSAKVIFDSLNPEEMSELRYETGASSVELRGLGNSNAAEVAFTGGAGDYTLDFSGDLQQDMDVTVKAGVSSVRIRVPAGATVEVNVDSGLSDVDTDGNWAQSGDTYTLSGSGPTITINVDMGVGSLKLEED
ncbi:MAG: hypothetical protein IT318_10590 [Anaerolineales bacterium]|nr:hypothetical protein [Anaerolineales bacterium]